MIQRDYDERTWAKVCELHTDLASLRSTVDTYIAGQHQICEHRREEIKALHYVVNGNGKVGLKDDVKWLVGREKARQKIVGWTLAFLAANLGGIVYTLRLLKQAAALVEATQ